MAAEILPGITDDSGFIKLLNSMVGRLLVQVTPRQLWVIQIDNWFDHKWLRFSGHGAITSNIAVALTESVKVEFHQDELTFPPFAPDRVLGQWSYVRQDNEYRESSLPMLPHSTERLHTFENLHRRIQDIVSSGCFVWYSANTLSNGRGSVMVYTVKDESTECWFAAFSRGHAWKLGATKGVGRAVVLKLLA
jgi:hypothetical protein